MRLSEFTRAVEAEFGPRGGAFVDDLVIAELGHRTPQQALAAGVDPRTVWLALCAETDVPIARRHGVGRLEPRR
ncbi:DUF3046 domain-containing protein [Microbacterium sp. W1N]|uniref:DUF3046 domain-containing protein n=1 Tax=Microbacterium festucae TaxID=2977531 RepID=UPI0021C02A6B|nr:DUF3046 domain-containing protein [Microbacterium festucae]MCT9821499.1 DUF3046 domain-containing protein [Microbacterium festucae]